MKLNLVLRELHRAETALARNLRRAAERHKVEHEVHHVALDLAEWSARHVRDLAATARGHGLSLDAHTADHPGLPAPLRTTISELAVHRPEPGLLLLRDLRALHRATAGLSVDWELLAQAAQAAREPDLLALAQRCHPDTLRQLKWTNATLKVLSPQILTS
ncbi:hypothetical protein L6E12_11395 [Actinokineospora sp. PR83]|uniref:hypothetical protein n=1 Tax=Actinokineospora sp. PR83 TaxID=2884908 RepID=UPI0027DEB885|nr:hypothetical protein [Actinokineospora sp. PR83]MCG8916394.1 hypothetical protein [Actinokineospora sp. PR83]